MKHKKLIITLMSVVTVLSITGVVFAYLTANNNINNTLTVGKNEVEVSEDFVAPDEQKTDTKYKKQISAVNTGNINCYTRVYVDFSDDTIRSNSYFSNGSDIDNEDSYHSAIRDITNTDSYVYYNETKNEYPNLPKNWIFVPDNSTYDKKLSGYYYYTEPLAPNEITTPLFTFIRTKYNDANSIKQYDVIVYAESVQTTDADGKAYSDYKTAWNDFLNN